ncbi:MAG: 3-deoxy-D-manno-octulosonic acid kinase [Lonepinella koalarum]|nr:3-deoxy-D-manno-octulosonic acid kinase [Lonepinella koalarum]
MMKLQQKNLYFLLAEEKFSALNYADFFLPEFWQAQERIVGSAKGRGVTWFVKSDDLLGVNCALRHYYRGGLWGKIVKDHYYFSTLENCRSFAELRLLDKLYQAGLPVPKPIMARVERIWGGYRADILLEKIENAQDLTSLLQTSLLSAEEWQYIGKLIRQLHDLQICHTDLNAHNILAQQTENGLKFYLIDFDKCGEKQGTFWKAQNLQRLKRSFLKEKERMGIKFSEEHWSNLVQGYTCSVI